jgi:hypothetical protein
MVRIESKRIALNVCVFENKDYLCHQIDLLILIYVNMKRVKTELLEMWKNDREGLIGGILIVPMIYGFLYAVAILQNILS